MRSIAVYFGLLLVAACSTTAPPVWQSDAFDALEQFRVNYFEGHSRDANRDFAKAKSAFAATGRLDLAARAELIRCAYGVAALDFDACSGFEPLRKDAVPEDLAYGDFLVGRLEPSGIGKLPTQYRDVASAADEANRLRALRKIEDPVSRLIAAGALFKRAQLAPDGVAMAIDTSATQGLRRPLLAWLNVALKRAEAGGDSESVEILRRRIALAAGGSSSTSQ